MQLSVIIPCYNATQIIGEQLEALAQQEYSYDWEILIADNGSNEGMEKLIDSYKERLPPIQIIFAQEKRGPAFARNMGASHARGKYLIFLDADDVVGDDWLKNIGKALEDHDFVASKLEITKLNPSNIIKNRGIEINHSILQFSVVDFLPYAASSGLGIRKNIHERIGGFDEHIRAAAGEDTDYCWRVQLAGHSLYFAEDALLHYRYRDTPWKSFQQAKNYGEYDVFLYKKYQKFNMPKQNKKKEIRKWKNIFFDIPKLNTPEKRLIWVRSVGKKLGRLKGSIKYRIFVP